MPNCPPESLKAVLRLTAKLVGGSWPPPASCQALALCRGRWLGSFLSQLHQVHVQCNKLLASLAPLVASSICCPAFAGWIRHLGGFL